MCIRFFNPKTITDLNGDPNMHSKSLSEIKKIREILIIDDEPFSYLETLKRHEYNITQKSDLLDLRDAEAYSIILSDIRGVGKFLESEYQGAYLIKQLKEKYPEKIIIAYTANDYNAEFQKYLNFADDTIPKGSFALEEWTSLLDKLLLQSVDPVKLWNKARKTLIEQGVPTYIIAKYESDYVTAIQKGKFESFQKIYENKSGNGSEIMYSLLKALPNIIIPLIKPV